MRQEVLNLVSRVNRYRETGLSLIKELRDANYGVILDIGCGKNLYKPFLSNVIGIDIVKPYDLYGDLAKLPIADNYADVCMCFSVLDIEQDTFEEHLLELIRVTKPGGKIIIRLGKMSTSALQDQYAAFVSAFTITHNLQLIELPRVITKVESPYTKNLFWVWKK